jgi:hypothetical protein
MDNLQGDSELDEGVEWIRIVRRRTHTIEIKLGVQHLEYHCKWQQRETQKKRTHASSDHR